MLIVENGIIQNKEIFGIPVKISIIEPSGNKNVRTLIPMLETIGQTVHNTGNTHPTAGDEMHAKYFQNVEDADKYYVAAHLFVDADSITQIIPLSEVAYHAGDGKGDGNRKTISVEICESENYEQCEENGKYLLSALNMYYGGSIYKHQDFNNKYCPRRIIPHWEDFKSDIYDIMKYYSGEIMNIQTIKQRVDWFGTEKQIEVNNIDGYTYFTADNLREFCDVIWDEEEKTIRFRMKGE